MSTIRFYKFLSLLFNSNLKKKPIQILKYEEKWFLFTLKSNSLTNRPASRCDTQNFIVSLNKSVSLFKKIKNNTSTKSDAFWQTNINIISNVQFFVILHFCFCIFVYLLSELMDFFFTWLNFFYLISLLDYK